MSRRERVIVIVTAVVMGLFVLDRYALTPLLEAREALEQRGTLLRQQYASDQRTITASLAAARRWKQMTESGLHANAADAEAQLLQTLRDWASSSGVTLASLKPERVSDRGELREVIVGASATGPMGAISRFIYQVEAAAIPVRVTRLHLDRRNDKSEELTLEIQVSTLYRDAAATKQPTTAAKERRS